MKPFYKTLILTLYILFFSISLTGQQLNLNEFQVLCSMNDYTEVDRYLRAKGWVYHDSKEGNNLRYHTITWAHSKNRYDDRAAAWFYLYAYDNVPSKISYQYHDHKHNTFINNSLLSLGYKKMEGNILDENVVTKYSNNNYIVGLRYSQSEDSDYRNAKSTTYHITMIKKSGIYDEDNGKKTTYYWGNVKNEDYSLRNGKLHGEYIKYNVNGNIIVKCNYIDGVTSGAFKLFYDDGILKKEGAKLNDKNHGNFKEYDENGNITVEYQMQNDELNGMLKSYWPNGKIRRTGNFKNGEEFGYFKEYNEEGKLQFEGELRGDSLNGNYKLYYENGNLKLSGAKKDGKQYGPFKEYFESGKISYDYGYNEIGLNGPFISFYENGIKEKTGNYKSANKNGLFVSYNQNGNKVFEENFADGILEGQFKSYYPDGKVSEQGSYLKGKKNGIWNRYDEKERLDRSEEFSDEKKNGKQIDYYYYDDKMLKVEGIQYFANDLRHGRNEIYVYTDTIKRIMSYGNYSFDKKNGDFMEISGDSVIFSSYKSDRLEGNYLIYRDLVRYLTGEIINTDTTKLVLIEKGNFSNNLKTGYWEFYTLYGGAKIKEGEYSFDKKYGPWKYYYSSIVDNEGNEVHYSKQLYLIEFFNNDDLYKTEKFSWFDKEKIPCPANSKEDTCFEQIFVKSHELCEYKNNTPHGFYLLEDSVGNLVAKGNLVNGKKNGEWEYLTWDGNTKIQRYIHYKMDARDGIFKEFNDGIIAVEGFYKNDKENGQFNYYIFGNIFVKENYINGILHGDKHQYNPQGGIFLFEKYENNQLKRLEKYSLDEPYSKEMDAEVTVRNGNSYIVLASFFKSDSVITSKLRVFAEEELNYFEIQEGTNYGEYIVKVNNQTRVRGNYFDNKKDGEWIFYLPEQKAEARIKYSSDNIISEYYHNTIKSIPLNGKVEFIYNNLNEREVIKVKDGVRHGVTQFYKGTETKPYKKITFKNGILQTK